MSETDSAKPRCGRCGTVLPTDAPEGICPRCLLALNLATQTEVSGEDGQDGAARTPPPPPPEPAEIAPLFPQLEILECLGRGGMGAVYKARQPKLDRFVALKILTRDKEQDPRFAERFAREAKTLAQLNHPNIVTIYDSGEAGGHCYLLMEYVDGLSLRQLIRAGKLKPEEALTIVPKICEALQFAHERRIVHRDIKPENILLDREGRVKIADFGIAKMLGADEGVGGKDTGLETGLESPVNPRTGKSALQPGSLTDAGKVVGTPNYMAPEQKESPQLVDHRADIYSLGVVFYEMLTGELPLGKFQPPSSRTHGVQIDVRLDEVVLRALAKEPELRYQQASQVKTAVEIIAAGEPKPEARNLKPETGRQDQGILAPAVTGPNRFSRRAIAGAIWISLFFLNWVVNYTPPGWALRHLFRNSPFGPACDLFLFVPLMVLGFAAMAGGPVIGVVALRQIRQARGEIRGWGLALFDVLFLPLLLVNWWIAWLTFRVGAQIGSAVPTGGEALPVPGPGPAIAAFVFIGLALNGLLIRAAVRMAKKFVNSPAPPARSPVTGAWSQVFKAAGLRLALVLVVQLALFETLEQVSWRWKESTGELWGIALAVATLGGLIWACWPGFHLKRSWLFWVGGTMISSFLLLVIDNSYSWHLRPNLGLYHESDWVAQHPNFQWSLRQETAAKLWRKPKVQPFGPPAEAFLPLDDSPRVALYDLDTGRQSSINAFDVDDAAISSWVRAEEMDLGFLVKSGQVTVLGLDLGVGWVPHIVPNEKLTSQAAVNFWLLDHRPAKTIETLSAPTNLVGRFVFRTREGGVGLCEFTGLSESPRGIRLRCRRVPNMSFVQRNSAATPLSSSQVPPVVISTVPESGKADVDPALAEIRVTFSKPMLDGSGSWSTRGKENVPESTGKSYYLPDGRICVLPVKLQPGRVYALWLNDGTHHDFKDAGGQPAVPYLLVFETRR